MTSTSHSYALSRFRRMSAARCTRTLWPRPAICSCTYNMIYLLTAIGLTPDGSSTVHFYTQTVHRTTQSTQTIHRTTQLTNWEECGPCPVFESYTLTFALQVRKKHERTSVRVAEECQLARWKQNIQNRTYITIRIYKHNNTNT